MKNTRYTRLLLSTLVLVFATFAQVNAQRTPLMRLAQGVGPVEAISVNASQLPDSALSLIHELFPGDSIASVVKNFAERDYSVRLSDGYRLLFNFDGDCSMISAPDSAKLSVSAVKKLIAEPEVIEVVEGEEVCPEGIIGYIESVKVLPEIGYVIQYRAPGDITVRELTLDSSGHLVPFTAEKIKMLGQARSSSMRSLRSTVRNVSFARRN